MIQCATCHTANIEGSFYCDECGSPLIAIDGTMIGTKTATLKLNVADLNPDPTHKPSWGTTYFKSSTIVSMHFQEKDEKIVLPPLEEVIFGRADERTKSYPDVDLTPYGAVDRGVSRSHASIRRNEDALTLVDLESVNGTYLNGQRVLPSQPRIIRDGDEVRFGKLVTRVYFK